MEFTEAVKRRRSVRKYDPDQAIDPDKVRQCIELSVLAPNSSNMQLWEFYHISSKDMLHKMSKFCFDQNAAKTAQQMVVVVVRKDLWRKRVKAHEQYLKEVFGDIPKKEQSKRAKFAFTYYKTIIPFSYADLFGIFGYSKIWFLLAGRPFSTDLQTGSE